MNKGGFGWKRFTGVSRVKTRISRATGIPLTRSGRQRKVGNLITGGGCAVVIASGLALSLLVGAVVGVAMATR